MHVRKITKVVENLTAGTQNTVRTWELEFDDRILVMSHSDIEKLYTLLHKEFTPKTKKIELPQAIKDLARAGKRLNAIKALRGIHALTLKEAMDAVDAWMGSEGLR